MIRLTFIAALLTSPALAADMHVTLPVESPYCGTQNGVAETCWMSNGAYPRPRHTSHGWVCPLQYHVSPKGCEEES
jgi:hypothetical protein